MKANLFYAVGTMLSWFGWFLAIRTVVLAGNFFSKALGVDRRRLRGQMLGSAIGAGLFLAIPAAIPMHAATDGTSAAGGPYRLPLVWFVMPWTAWLIVACGGFAAVKAFQAAASIPPKERQTKAGAAALWFGGLLIFLWLYRRDPANKIEILTGGIGFSAQTAAALVLFAFAGAFAMALAGRATATAGYAKTLVTQAMLLAGSVIFGLPFAFLVITSFKEDRDMSSPNGIVWVPRVENMRPYLDPKNPTYEGFWEGQPAQGQIIDRYPDGTVKIDVQKPLAIRGATFTAPLSSLKVVPKDVPVVEGDLNGVHFHGMVIHEFDDGRREVQIFDPPALNGRQQVFAADAVQDVRHIGLRTANYSEALDFLPPSTNHGLVYLKNTLILVVLSVIGTILSSSIVAYAFSRMKFPGRDPLFAVVLATMMLPGAVTLMPQFLIFRWFGWIDTLMPLWVPAFFGSAFNIFLLRQFFMQIPMELEDAAKIDGCSYPRTFWNIMLPQIKPALAVIAIWTFLGAWNNFMGPLIYVSSPDNMTLSYALKLFQGDRYAEPGLLMAFATLTMLPVLLLFFLCQRYFVEGVTLSGLGGR
jgi:multiple sugar transport system permease protein